MSRMPTRNLPPQAEPWGRAVDNQLATISRTNDKQAQDTGNALSAINGTLTRLGEQVSEIRTIADTLVAQQATLEAQQSVLSETVASLEVAVNGMLKPVTYYDDTTGFDITPDYQTVLTANLTVPPGYSQALVYGVSVASGSNDNDIAAYLQLRIVIQGIFGGGSSNQGKPVSWTQTTAAASKLVTGLAGGSTLTVSSQLRATSPSQTWINPGHNCRLAVQVIFLR